MEMNTKHEIKAEGEASRNFGQQGQKPSADKTRQLAIMGLLVALSAVGSFIKIPSPTGTVALDSAPGYLAAYLLGGSEGAIVASFGHLLTAVTAGFPLGLPIHAIIALQMAAFAYIFAWIIKKGNQSPGAIVAAVSAATLLNGIVAPLLLIPFFGMGFFVAMVLPLTIASLINILLATLLGKLLKNKIFPA